MAESVTPVEMPRNPPGVRVDFARSEQRAVATVPAFPAIVSPLRGMTDVTIDAAEVRRTQAWLFLRWQWRVRWHGADQRRRSRSGYAFTRMGAEASADKAALDIEHRLADAGWTPVGKRP